MCGQGMVGAAGIVAGALTGVTPDEDAARIDHLSGQLEAVGRLQDEVFGRIAVGNGDGLLRVVYQHQTAVVQRMGGKGHAREHLQLSVELVLHLLEHLFRRGDEQHLRVAAMLSLRQQVGGHEGRIGGIVGDDAHLGGTGGHVDGHIVEADGLLGSHDEAVAGPKDLVDLGHRGRAIGHRSDGLHTADLEDAADTCHTSGKEDSGMDGTLGTGRRAEHYLATACQSGGRGEHEHGAEKRRRATRHIETDALDGHVLLPAGDTRTGLHLRQVVQLGSMERTDVLIGLTDGIAQVGRQLLLGSVELLVGDLQTVEADMVELLFKRLHGSIAFVLHTLQHPGHHIIQCRQVDLWSLNNPFYVLFRGISDNIHTLHYLQLHSPTHEGLGVGFTVSSFLSASPRCPGHPSPSGVR